MSRISETFAQLKAAGRTALMPYLMVGFPERDSALELAPALEAAGADLFELGVPFSDPLADGPVIQRATERALAGGTTLAGVLEMLAGVRPHIRAPIVIFSYANPILRMGLDAF